MLDSLTIEHRHFARHGEGSADYRAAMGSAQGWPYILDRYKTAVSDKEIAHE